MKRVLFQGAPWPDLMKALNCYETEDQQRAFVISLCQLSEYYNGMTLKKIVLHGSVVLQHLLAFNKPIKLVRNITEMDQNQLVALMCDSFGCHVMDAFMKSTTIGEKSRNKLVEAFNGHCATLACDKYGSRSLDNMWHASSVKYKAIIATELVAKESELQKRICGRILFSKYFLDHFKKNHKNWSEIQSKNLKMKRMSESILQDAGKIKILEIS
ncbi:Nucleolar protein 9 [Nymphon striatum]|nr:Nucleolar protein 9 [Nymphon striatum]